MKITRQTRQWTKWGGPLADIVAAAQEAETAIAKWKGAQPSVVTVVAYPNRTDETDSITEMDEAIDIRDLDLLRSIRITIGEAPSGRVVIHVERTAPSITLEAQGDDATQVSGLFTNAVTTLSRGVQSDRISWIAALLAAATLAVVIYWMNALNLFDERNSHPSNLLGALGLLALVLAAFAIFVSPQYLVPALELLPPDRNTRLTRWRRVLGAAAGTLGLGILASGIYAALHALATR